MTVLLAFAACYSAAFVVWCAVRLAARTDWQPTPTNPGPRGGQPAPLTEQEAA